MSESTYDILWPEDSRSPETLLLQAESRISALEAALAKADELAAVVYELQEALSEAREGQIVNYGEHVVSAYRQARDATR